MVITPPHMQLQVHDDVSAGRLLIWVEVAPGDHGATVLGTQAEGVGTPSAAAVAAATAGLASLVHIPKDGMFTMGA